MKMQSSSVLPCAGAKSGEVMLSAKLFLELRNKTVFSNTAEIDGDLFLN